MTHTIHNTHQSWICYLSHWILAPPSLAFCLWTMNSWFFSPSINFNPVMHHRVVLDLLYVNFGKIEGLHVSMVMIIRGWKNAICWHFLFVLTFWEKLIVGLGEKQRRGNAIWTLVTHLCHSTEGWKDLLSSGSWTVATASSDIKSSMYLLSFVSFTNHNITKSQALRSIHLLINPLNICCQLKSNLFLVCRQIITESPNLPWDEKI